MRNRKELKTSDITVTAAMAALVFLGTYVFKIPTISGYIHLGDCMILLTVVLFGTRKGAVAGAIGAGLSDLLGGFAYWVLPTILIKCMWALVLGAILRRAGKGRKGAFLAGAVAGGVLQLAAYTGIRVFLYGMYTAVAEIPGLALQTGAGVVLSLVIYQVLVKSGLAVRLRTLAG